ncbi:hypothetical protein NC653_004788 [Populus alba x Populus x berolinensis]|uniref:Uncharacterized protein n=1 Tax=Populus alba x Populus x berolinensis TaxID=444605 RepID=A0AAD6WNV6_9ROSI|nr:hypothetical protein NC653_004788 [Populus alba x Populus x berolinensis]
MMLQMCKLVIFRKNDELRKDAVDALCCLAHALGEDFTIFIPSIHKLLLKHRLRHKEFEEIEGRLRRREPIILGSTAAQRLSRQLPMEPILLWAHPDLISYSVFRMRGPVSGGPRLTPPHVGSGVWPSSALSPPGSNPLRTRARGPDIHWVHF